MDTLFVQKLAVDTLRIAPASLGGVSPLTIVLISVAGALVGALIGSGATLYLAHMQFRANVKAASRRDWIDKLRHTLAQLNALTLRVINADEGLKVAGATNTALTAEYFSAIGEMSYSVSMLKLLCNSGTEEHFKLMQLAEEAMKHLDLTKPDHSSLYIAFGDVLQHGMVVLKAESDLAMRGK
jgi:gas vesicle protein